MPKFSQSTAERLLSEPQGLLDCVRETKQMRENLTELQIDKTLMDSFPASDPPAWY